MQALHAGFGDVHVGHGDFKLFHYRSWCVMEYYQFYCYLTTNYLPCMINGFIMLLLDF